MKKEPAVEVPEVIEIDSESDSDPIVMCKPPITTVTGEYNLLPHMSNNAKFPSRRVAPGPSNISGVTTG